MKWSIPLPLTKGFLFFSIHKVFKSFFFIIIHLYYVMCMFSVEIPFQLGGRWSVQLDWTRNSCHLSIGKAKWKGLSFILLWNYYFFFFWVVNNKNKWAKEKERGSKLFLWKGLWLASLKTRQPRHTNTKKFLNDEVIIFLFLVLFTSALKSCV